MGHIDNALHDGIVLVGGIFYDGLAEKCTA